MEILIVGAGNMGKTYAESFLLSQSITKDDLLILERAPEKVEALQANGYRHVICEPSPLMGQVKLVILAIKPQDIKGLFERIAPFMHAEQVVLSVMAGVTIDTIKQDLPTTKIIRAMPNLPAQIGMGMTAFTAEPSVTRAELFFVQNLLNTTGKSLYFDKEEKLDAVTAISGSGPAYVYFFMDAMIQAAEKMGFSPSQAELLVTQTFMGAVHLENRSPYSCREWIEKVASKGGTTEAALGVFQAQDLEEKIAAGLQAAHQRAIELGRG
ncbi:pyrroline-5-carboxylate reductase [Hugenholtzia roseola]|uniref:pyrroline-5-carboxylate reductase n=1 Tax=Hugenholtzia roseola TaxID=1002 RepID=UPI0004009251|nr:pyrroline-5-carboxylate reductase [Hugenholtzia roseola]